MKDNNNSDADDMFIDPSEIDSEIVVHDIWNEFDDDKYEDNDNITLKRNK